MVNIHIHRVTKIDDSSLINVRERDNGTQFFTRTIDIYADGQKHTIMLFADTVEALTGEDDD